MRKIKKALRGVLFYKSYSFLGRDFRRIKAYPIAITQIMTDCAILSPSVSALSFAKKLEILIN